MVGMSVVSLPQPADDMGYPSASGSSNKAPGNAPVNYSEVYCAVSTWHTSGLARADPGLHQSLACGGHHW